MAQINQPRAPIYTAEGGKASHISPLLQLRRTVLACMLWEKTFYEEGQDVATRIATLAKQCKPYEVADLAIEARNKYKLRHVPLLLVCALAAVGNTGSMVSQTLREIIQRPDELTEFLAIYWKDGKKSIAAQVKKGLAKAFQKFNAYQLAKYNRDGAIKLRDVLFLVHATPVDDEQAETWKQLVENTLPSPDTWEVALSAGADKKATFERLISEGKLGYLALLRNLRNMSDAGVDVGLVRDALLSGAKGSRALPFRFVAAARACPRWEAIIDEAMQLAVEGTERLPGRTILFVDVSGSMSDPLSAKSDMKRGDAAGALGVLLRSVCDDVRIFTFANDLTEVPARNGLALADLLKPQIKGTELGKCLGQLASKGVHDYDRIIVITDEQTRDSMPKPLRNGYILNVATNKNGIGYGNWTKIDGFSEAVVSYIQECEKDAS